MPHPIDVVSAYRWQGDLPPVTLASDPYLILPHKDLLVTRSNPYCQKLSVAIFRHWGPVSSDVGSAPVAHEYCWCKSASLQLTSSLNTHLLFSPDVHPNLSLLMNYSWERVWGFSVTSFGFFPYPDKTSVPTTPIMALLHFLMGHRIN